MSAPSTEVKSRWNAKAYDVLSVRLPKELVSSFKAEAERNGESQASIIRRAVEAYIKK